MAELIIHNVIHHPQCSFGNANREFADLNPVKLIHIYQREHRDVKLNLSFRFGLGMDFLQDFNLKQPQLPIGDNEEITTPAGRIKEFHLPQFFLKPAQFRNPPRIFPGSQTVKFIT